jgi:two-component system, chemotaxis family, protein-glutamate methylesterase/glutaminase
VTGPVVVVGASAGGVEALRSFAAGLPVALPAPVVVVLHIPRSAPSALPAILARSGPLPSVAAEHGAPLAEGVIHVAPADRHVLVEDGRLVLSAGPAENGHRPAVDPLFRSAALAHGARAVGVVLSGTSGLAAIARRGGTAFVQDLREALYPSMPASALEHVAGARALPAMKLGPEIAELLARPRADRDGDAAEDGLLLAEHRIAAAGPGAPVTESLGAAVPSGLSCPDCDGVLFELPGRPAPRFRCRVGHAWTGETLALDQQGGVDSALWTALRTLEERVALLHRLAEHAATHGHGRSAERHRARAAEAAADAAVVRRLLSGRPGRSSAADA